MSYQDFPTTLEGCKQLRETWLHEYSNCKDKDKDYWEDGIIAITSTILDLEQKTK